MKASPAADRVMAKVEIRDDCWIFTGFLRKGYGRVGVGAGLVRPAHRVVWEAANGPVPAGLQLDHVCHSRDADCTDVPCVHRACVNPAHLEPVTPLENARRKKRNGPAPRATCARGHDLSVHRRRQRKTNDPYCAACSAIRLKAWRQRRALQ